MTKKGFRWNKYKNLEEKIVSILRDNPEKTINDIKSDLDKIGLNPTWKTLRDYLYKMLENKQVKLKTLGTRKPLLLWSV
jgi:hypothetical protein